MVDGELGDRNPSCGGWALIEFCHDMPDDLMICEKVDDAYVCIFCI